MLPDFSSGHMCRSSSSGSVQSKYNQGKYAYHNKLACRSCPLESLRLNQQTAQQVLTRLGPDGDLRGALRSTDRRAVTHYLKKRYKLR